MRSSVVNHNSRQVDSHQNRRRSSRRDASHQGQRSIVRPVAAHRSRALGRMDRASQFSAPEKWHDPTDAEGYRCVIEPAGTQYQHVVTEQEIRDRLDLLPKEFIESLGVVQLSRMTRKRAIFPLYGMQWGPNVYLYPMECSLTERYARKPRPQFRIDSEMYGGVWEEMDGIWQLSWNDSTIKDFYLNNVLIHEIGHLNDHRNRSYLERERYANWFAIEYGYRTSRGRR